MKISLFNFIVFLILNIAGDTTFGEQPDKQNSRKRFTIMGLGDSITQGGETFQVYLCPLWEKLMATGYNFDFIGPNKCKCETGIFKTCGFGGKNAQFLEAHIDSLYRNYPADIVLLHAGHNHFNTENPVPGIIKAQESIIHKILVINPNTKILVAKVITSGKLPKYSYIPDLNRNIALMVKRLNHKNVFLVDQSKGFDWQKHTIGDKVHPNSLGAEHMAQVWFKALREIMK